MPNRDGTGNGKGFGLGLGDCIVNGSLGLQPNEFYGITECQVAEPELHLGDNHPITFHTANDGSITLTYDELLNKMEIRYSGFDGLNIIKEE